MALASAHRISKVGALSAHKELYDFKQEVLYRLDPVFMPKINTSFHRYQEIILPSFFPNCSHSGELRWQTLNFMRALCGFKKRH